MPEKRYDSTLPFKYTKRTSFICSTVEGLALGIEQDNSGIWMNFGATAMHKFVVAFSVGVELVSAQVWKNYFLLV